METLQRKGAGPRPTDLAGAVLATRTEPRPGTLNPTPEEQAACGCLLALAAEGTSHMSIIAAPSVRALLGTRQLIASSVGVGVGRPFPLEIAAVVVDDLARARAAVEDCRARTDAGNVAMLFRLDGLLAGTQAAFDTCVRAHIVPDPLEVLNASKMLAAAAGIFSKAA